MEKKLSEYLRKIGSVGGKKAAERMTKAERSERARKAAAARYRKGGK